MGGPALAGALRIAVSTQPLASPGGRLPPAGREPAGGVSMLGEPFAAGRSRRSSLPSHAGPVADRSVRIVADLRHPHPDTGRRPAVSGRRRVLAHRRRLDRRAGGRGARNAGPPDSPRGAPALGTAHAPDAERRGGRAVRGRLRVAAGDHVALDKTRWACSRPFKVSMKVPFAVSAGWREEPRRAGCRAGFWWPGWRGGGQSVAVSSAIAVRAADSSAMVLPAVQAASSGLTASRLMARGMPRAWVGMARTASSLNKVSDRPAT